MLYLLTTLFAGAVALGSAVILSDRILTRKVKDSRIKEVSEIIQESAGVFLRRQYKAIGLFTLILFLCLFLLSFVLEELTTLVSLTFLTGAIFSASAGFMGMYVAVRANARSVDASKEKIDEAFSVAFQGGLVTGLLVCGLGLIGVSLLYHLTGSIDTVVGFGFGTALVALFARVGGGIYTKAADIGADLVGKVEVGIPEDDPRNPAVIADLVGDNVGDVAGMAADVFESYACTLIATLLIGWAFFKEEGVIFPLEMQSFGIFSSLIMLVFTRKVGRFPLRTINRGMFGVGITFAILSAVSTWFTFGGDMTPYFAILIGLAAVLILALLTQYYTSYEMPPVREIAKASQTGPATNFLMGMAVGLESTAFPVVVVCVSMLAAYSLQGLYGVGLAAIGFLSLAPLIVALDAYGPIIDNASGIAEMAKLGGKVRRTLERLDSVGNTTKAMCKGFAIGAAAFAAIALFAAYIEDARLETLIIADPAVISGAFIGAMLSFVFCSMILRAVGRAAFRMVNEVRRQFRDIPGVKEGETRPNYEKCVDISTKAALEGILLPGALSVAAPLAIGILLGKEALGGLLLGNIACSFPLALFLAHSGTAWDNAKKFIEMGNLGGKGTATHAAAVIGDTVGDPFKDAAGPSLNILMDIVATIALLLAPIIAAI